MKAAECRGFGEDRTKRPDARGAVPTVAHASDAGGPSALLPTIADVLQLPAVVVADPEVLTAGDQLTRPVRWVHVTATESVAGLLNGGELLLSTGAGWPARESDLAGYVAELAEIGVAGLVLELGGRYRAAPSALIEACAQRAVPLIVLHSQARFIAITEAVHSRIITDQTNALRARDEIHALFTELSLRGSPADFIVAQLGRVLGSPVVLEDLNHRVIAAETLQDDAVLADWEHASRGAHRAAASEATDVIPDAVRDPDAQAPWLVVPVEARGTRWGYLLALPGRAHPAGRSTVLEQAAVALALSRLADRDADEWIQHSQRALMDTLLSGRFRSEHGLRARLEASGLTVTGRGLVGVAITAGEATPAAVRQAADAMGIAVLAAPVADRADSAGVTVAALSMSTQLTDRDCQQLAKRIRAAGGGAVVAFGSESVGVRGLLSSIEEAIELLGTGRQGGADSSVVRNGSVDGVVLRVENRPLLRLVTALAGDPRLQAHSESMLRPLIEHDLASGGDLLDVLGAYLAHPGNRTAAASASHLSRSVFYQRLARIEDLLGTDLNDGETLTAVHVALLARRHTTRG